MPPVHPPHQSRRVSRTRRAEAVVVVVVVVVAGSAVPPQRGCVGLVCTGTTRRARTYRSRVYVHTCTQVLRSWTDVIPGPCKHEEIRPPKMVLYISSQRDSSRRFSSPTGSQFKSSSLMLASSCLPHFSSSSCHASPFRSSVSFCQVTAISTGPASPWHPHSVTEVADRLGEKKKAGEYSRAQWCRDSPS